MKKFLNPLIIALSLPLSALACERPQVAGYDYVGCLSEDLAVVQKNSKYGFIDKTGEIVIPVQYDLTWDFAEGLARVKQEGKWGYIDKTGMVVVPIYYDDMENFLVGDLVLVKQNDKYGLLDNIGRIVAPVQYDDIWSFLNDSIRVQQDGKYGFFRYNRQGDCSCSI
ncbi:WG repeat-containing protein [Moraxella bovis]|uniref:WG repeat-containing protein n=1 Tax=Moraxella bovis TaxID=476 RepID=A0AAQ2Q8K8_MORBO|nr:WG repeat-containing protein [Moraxella bovis]AWY19693.1 WG repeat-containing protein [Moraxella bovis]OOR90163.1 hypothetical protein B0182_06045 [Moraxella bovis]UYZ75185.1 WG repeat-containing protein [Moraxella bovis]UYZ78883.1 WG repeat-containing protein [Moraxella bovis]UYZ80530.1 WG repeat-containing protein [Moraxella bovis]